MDPRRLSRERLLRYAPFSWQATGLEVVTLLGNRPREVEAVSTNDNPSQVSLDDGPVSQVSNNDAVNLASLSHQDLKERAREMGIGARRAKGRLLKRLQRVQRRRCESGQVSGSRRQSR
eukprot:s3224_g8.t2